MDIALDVISGLLALTGVVVYFVFRYKTVDEAREMISRAWPARFIAYRSGRGRHTPRYIRTHVTA
jgi:hypothetical protein